MDRRPAPEPVDADDRGRGGGLLDRHDHVADQDVERGGLAGGGGELLANRSGDITEVELPGDHARQLREAAAEPVPRGPLVALDQRMALQSAQQAQRGRAVNVQPARDLCSGVPAPLRKQVQDGDRPFHGTDGERTVDADEFFLGVYLTAVGPGELLTRIRIPAGRSDGFAAVTALVRHLLTDPALPGDLTPPDWPAEALRASYDDYRSQLHAHHSRHEGVLT